MTFIVELLSHKTALVLIFSFIVSPAFFIYGIFKKKPIYNFLALVLIGLAMLNMFLGSRVTNSIIDKNGVLGTAIITDMAGTGDYYNYEESIQYNVLIKTKEGKTMETSFDSADHNVYPTPAEGKFSYPDQGVEFSVKYLPDAPEHFIILLNEDSAFAKELGCEELLKQLNSAEQKMNFDQTNQEFKADYERLQKAYNEKECA